MVFLEKTNQKTSDPKRLGPWLAQMPISNMSCFFFAKKQAFLVSKSSAIVLALALARCAPVDALNAITPTGGVTITKNITYGTADRERLDLYRPNDTAPHPIIMFIYGGAWNSGSKSIYPFVAATLARRGNIVVVPDYRLYPEVKYPVFLEDNAKAFAWTVAHAQKYNGNGTIFLMGHSAGAYNAAMLALDPKYLQQAGTSRDRVTGFIGLAGPYDFLPIVDPEVIAVFGSTDDPSTQPITYVDPHAPPMLLLAGADDTTVRPKNTISLAARVNQAGGHATANIIPGTGHIGLILAIAPAFRWPLFGKSATVLPQIQAFIDAHAGQRPAQVPISSPN
jgi:acetyl esterase/lipase